MITWQVYWLKQAWYPVLKQNVLDTRPWKWFNGIGLITNGQTDHALGERLHIQCPYKSTLEKWHWHYNNIWVIIKIHTLFCYYAIKRQISTKLIGENMFCMKAHQLSIVLPSKSRLVQLRIYTCYTKTSFFLGVTWYFSRITYF